MFDLQIIERLLLYIETATKHLMHIFNIKAIDDDCQEMT